MLKKIWKGKCTGREGSIASTKKNGSCNWCIPISKCTFPMYIHQSELRCGNVQSENKLYGTYNKVGGNVWAKINGVKCWLILTAPFLCITISHTYSIQPWQQTNERALLHKPISNSSSWKKFIQQLFKNLAFSLNFLQCCPFFLLLWKFYRKLDSSQFHQTYCKWGTLTFYE